MSFKQPLLPDLISDLRRLLSRLERYAAKDGRSLSQQVIDVLSDCGDLSTSAVARLIHRRRADVLSTLKLMHSAGQIARHNGKWSVEDGQ